MLADRERIAAEALPPQRVRNDRDVPSVRVFLGRERPSDCGVYRERLEIAVGDCLRRCTRSGVPRPVTTAVTRAKPAMAEKDFAVALVVHEIRRRHHAERTGGPAGSLPLRGGFHSQIDDEPIGGRVGQRTQHGRRRPG